MNSGTSYLLQENCPYPSYEDKSSFCGEPMVTRDNRYYQTAERIQQFSTQNNDLPLTIVSVASIFRFFVQYVGYKVIHCIHGGSFTNVQNVQEFHLSGQRYTSNNLKNYYFIA